MKAFMCTVCGFLYDEESAEKGIDGTLITFEDLNDDWVCPICGVRPDFFESTTSHRTPDVPLDEG